MIPNIYVNLDMSFQTFMSTWICHSKHSCQLGHVIPNIHVILDHFPLTLDISCHSEQCHKRPCFLLVHEQIKTKLVATAVHLCQHADFHPTRATEGEKVLNGLEQRSMGILINTKAIRFHLDKEKITKEMDLLEKQMVIAYFVGGRISEGALQRWVSSLSKEINEDCRIGL